MVSHQYLQKRAESLAREWIAPLYLNTSLLEFLSMARRVMSLKKAKGIE